jgi:antitoxin (DNA-binding transcriptional repressor) of toxin-antitoxin stability system/predicted nucleic acid-binding protein
VTSRDYLQLMKVVGIKQLKARLSEYVRLVKAGETVLVTERDEVVAELRPSRRQSPMADRLEELSKPWQLQARSAGRLNQRATGPGTAAAWGCRRGPRRRCSTICGRIVPDRTMEHGAALYLDTSVALRAPLEQGTPPEIGRRIAGAPALLTSHLVLVESARALLRIRLQGGVPETRLADARRELDELWNRCELWELTPAVCNLACLLAPDRPLRTLDTLHLATFLIARARIEGLELLSADRRVQEAANSA